MLSDGCVKFVWHYINANKSEPLSRSNSCTRVSKNIFILQIIITPLPFMLFFLIEVLQAVMYNGGSNRFFFLWEKMFFHFHCSCHATRLPCKTSIGRRITFKCPILIPSPVWLVFFQFRLSSIYHPF